MVEFVATEDGKSEHEEWHDAGSRKVILNV